MNPKNEEFAYSSILDAYQNTKGINLQSGKALLAGVRLDSYFRDPENPSKEEIILFELEHGEGMYKSALAYWMIITSCKARN